MEHRFDVVSVGIANERTEVARVVFGPQAWRVQRLGTQAQGRVVERLHGLGIGRMKRDVDFPIGPACVAGTGVGDPEVGLTFTAVTDGDLVVQLPAVAEYAQHSVVELLRFGPVGAVDSKVIDHRSIVAFGTDTLAPVPRTAVASYVG